MRSSLLGFALISALGVERASAAQSSAAARAAALGAERCVDCHEHIVESYARSGMARALGPIEPGELEGLDAVPAGSTGYSYRLLQESSAGGGRAWIEETWRQPAGAGGDPVQSAAPLAFAIGAGILDRSYVALAGGRWWFAPLEVLSAHGGHERRAALAPGHAVQPLARLSNPIGEDCLACHTDRLPPRSYPLNLAPPPGAGWTPRGISCAACHGDVEAHADWRERDLAGERPDGADPVLDHGALSLEERLSVCARCHLQGDARIALVPGRRGLPPPGADLLASTAVFLPPGDDGEIAFVSHVERMVASPCYTASLAEGRARLSCESCHDPHRSLTDPVERARVRGACSRCHGSSPEPGRSGCTLPRAERGQRGCADCHMRRTGVFDVAQVEITDHLIARVPAPPRRTERVRILHTTDGRLTPFTWPGRPRPAYAEDPGLALMAAMIARAPERARPLVDRPPSAAVRGLAGYHHLRAIALEGLGRSADAERAYAEVLRLEPDSPDSAVNRALLLGRAGRGVEGVRLLDELLARHPAADNALRNRAVLELGLGDAAGFVADLEAAHRLRPDAALARSLASLHSRRGDRVRAAELEEEARRLAPHEPRER